MFHFDKNSQVGLRINTVKMNHIRHEMMNYHYLWVCLFQDLLCALCVAALRAVSAACLIDIL